LTIILLQTYCWVCFESIFKIAQHLANVMEKKLIASRALCAGALSCWKTKNSL